MRSFASAVGGASLLILAAAPARGQNIVANPGFETGSFAPWTQWGNTANTGVTFFALPHSGSWVAFFSPNGSPGGIYQDLAATPGTTYLLSFWLGDFLVPGGGGTSSFFAVNWEGTNVFTLSNPDPFGYTLFSVPVIATTNSPQLLFSLRQDPNEYWELDDISVVASGTTADVNPEPATIVLLGTGLAGLMGAARKRKR